MIIMDAKLIEPALTPISLLFMRLELCISLGTFGLMFIAVIYLQFRPSDTTVERLQYTCTLPLSEPQFFQQFLIRAMIFTASF